MEWHDHWFPKSAHEGARAAALVHQKKQQQQCSVERSGGGVGLVGEYLDVDWRTLARFVIRMVLR